MKKTETLEIIKRLIVMFPSFKFGEIPDGISGGSVNPIEFWHQQIGDMEYEIAEKAVINCIDRCKFVPTAADIREEYEYLVSERNKDTADIREYYIRSANSYPIEIPKDYGWEEWQRRADTGEKAKTFNHVIMQYINHLEGDAIDFKKCVETICRDSDGKIFFKEAK